MSLDVTEGQWKHFCIPALICSVSSAEDNSSSFVLPFFPTLGPMGYPIEMIECIGMVDTG